MHSLLNCSIEFRYFSSGGTSVARAREEIAIFDLKKYKISTFSGKRRNFIAPGECLPPGLPLKINTAYILKSKFYSKFLVSLSYSGFKTVWYIKYFATLQVVNRAFCFYTFFFPECKFSRQFITRSSVAVYSTLIK